MVSERGIVGRGVLGSGVATNAFRQRVSSSLDPVAQEIASLENSKLAGLVPSGGRERLLQQEPRYEAGQLSSEIYGYEDVSSRGPVSTLFDFFGRGQSAFTGALTGFLGMEREGEEDRGPNLGVAAERFSAGLSGNQRYRFSEFTDTGKRIERGEDVGLFARGWNSALGFVIDTAVDPLTYVSFGGSIMGRMRAANAIRGSSQTALLRGASGEGFDAVRFMDDAFQKNVTRTDKLALDINSKAKAIGIESNISSTSSYDDILAESRRVFQDTNVDLVREVALDYIPDVAAMSYARRSAAGLRRWAVDTFGEEAGEAYFKSLPKDIQGGIRVRIPFARDADNTPIAIGIDGIGAGRLGDKYAPFRKVEDLTQAGRDIAREIFEGALGRFSGSSGSIYYEAVIAATGRRVRESRQKSQSTWVDYQGSKMMDESRRALRATFDEKFLKTHETAAQLYEKADIQHGDKFKTRFREYMYNSELIDEKRTSMEFDSEVDKLAFTVANTWRSMLDDIGKEAVEVFNDANMAFHFLKDYVPRITAKKAEADRFLRSKGTGKPGTKPQYVKQRGQWADAWSFDKKGNAIVVRWMPNEDILDAAGKKVYEDDPTTFMSVYLSDVRSSLNEQKILKQLRDNNLLTPSEMQTLDKINEMEIQRRVVELVGDVENPDLALQAEAFNVQKFVDELENPAFLYQRVGDYAQADAMALYMQRSGVDFATINDINVYQQSGNDWVNIIDGSIIRRLKGNRYVVLDSKGKQMYSNERITLSGKDVVGEDRGVPLQYDKLERAQAEWNQLQIANRENIYYNRYVVEKRQEVWSRVSEIFNDERFANIHQQSLARMGDEEKTTYIEAWMDALRLFNLDEPELVVTKDGSPAFARGLGKEPIQRQVSEPTDEFRQWIEDAGYMNIGGIEFDENGILNGASQVLVKQRIAQQMVNEYAPRKLMENVQRMFQVTQAPQTAGQRFINDFYKPLYTAQKAWMTLGRGPGFVSRNVMGGSWNNFVNGVTRTDNLASARILAARRYAKRQLGLEDKIKNNDIFDIEPLEIESLYRKHIEDYLRKFYSEEELLGDRGILEAWYTFMAQGLSGNRETARLYGELLRGRLGRTPDTQRLPGSRVRLRERLGDTRGGTEAIRDEDLSKLERGLEWAAGDNWWIRDVMSPLVELSEDYLRFAAFLTGVREVGLEPVETGVRGYAAAQWVKATQFDYADLSDFEQAIKFIVPFYSWTRNNVPLQLRVFVQQPGRVAQALRIHESLGAMFSDEEENISPSYISDRFGITFDENNPFFDMLPMWMRPQGDVTMGITWGEPIADVNTIFRDPTYAGAKGLNRFINIREVANQLNPIVAAGSAAQQAFSESSSANARNVEDAPVWARLGLAREDPTEPGTFIANRSTLDIVRNLIPVIDQAERVIPFFGGERQEGRWTTSIVSNLFGLNLSTVDDWQKASEMQRRTDYIQSQMKDDFGADWEYRNELVRRLLNEGATTDFIRALNLQDVNAEEVDVLKAIHSWRFLRRMELLIEDGVPEDEIVAALSSYAPEGSEVESLIQLIWDYVPKPSSDFETGVRYYGLQPVTRNDLEELGLTVNDVRAMTEDQQRRLVLLVNRNRGWTGPQS